MGNDGVLDQENAVGLLCIYLYLNKGESSQFYIQLQVL